MTKLNFYCLSMDLSVQGRLYKQDLSVFSYFKFRSEFGSEIYYEELREVGWS